MHVQDALFGQAYSIFVGFAIILHLLFRYYVITYFPEFVQTDGGCARDGLVGAGRPSLRSGLEYTLFKFF